MHSARHFQHLRFPWRFNEKVPCQHLPLIPRLERELQPYQSGFLYAFQQTMDAIAASDFSFLETILEPRLLSEFKDGVATVKRRGHRLDLQNVDCNASLSMYNAEILCGLDVTRDYNSEHTLQREWLPEIRRSTQRLPIENIKVFTSPSVKSHLILKLDVIFRSERKLIVADQYGQVLFGGKKKGPESHKFRFEAFVEGQTGALRHCANIAEVLRYYVFSIGQNPISLDNWFVTDIDDFLSKNPFPIANRC